MPNKGGRPTDYKPEYAEQVVSLCRLGATEKEIAEFFGKSTTTITTWKQKHPEFLAALKEGKQVADMAVAESLFRKAIGHTVKIEKSYKGKDGKIEVVKLDAYVEPDVTAMIFWLKNRRPDVWRDAHKHEHSGNVQMTWADLLGRTITNGNRSADTEGADEPDVVH